jgi:hypothetical protein
LLAELATTPLGVEGLAHHILWDAPGHVREAVNDNEIIASGLAASRLLTCAMT